MGYAMTRPYGMSMILSWRFLLLGASLALCLLWIVAQPDLHAPRDMLASAKTQLHDSIYGDGDGGNANSAPSLGSANPGDRPLVMYAYAESETARVDLQFFVRNGIHRRADFIFVFNGESDAIDMVPQSLPNVWAVQRNNTCFDMGGMGEVLQRDNLWKRYKRFITMNASLRGPFLPIYSNDCWTDLFLSRLTAKTKLVGITMNCAPRPHVQSMIWATDDVGMGVLLNPDLAHSVQEADPFGDENDPVGLTACYPNWRKAVHGEVGTTQLITSQGYDVDVMMTAFHGQNKDEGKTYCEATGSPRDHLLEGAYFGSNVHPYETIFAKANRAVDQPLMDHLTEWHMRMDHTSWQVCGA